MSDDLVTGGCVVASFILMAAGAIGWVLNVAKIFWAANDPLTLMIFIRLVGVICFPIGCIIGWL